MSRDDGAMELGITRGEDGSLTLTSPEVGEFTGAAPRGLPLAPGMVAGSLHQLGRSIDLIVPATAYGMITSDAPRRRMEPVGFGDVLYTLDPEGVASGGATAEDDFAALDGDALTVRAGQPGRVWRRPSPGEPTFCDAGDVLEDGAALCMIEVMKTFSTVPYRATGGLPGRARVVRWLVEDGADVEQGAALLHIEPA